MGWLCNWYGPPRQPVCIEAQRGFHTLRSLPTRVAGSFLSGGVDSLATLRAIRLDLPRAYPYAIKSCLIVHGFDIGGGERAGDEADCFEQAVTCLQEIAADVGVGLIPVHTNVRHLDDDVYFWMHEFHGAALAAVARALSDHFAELNIASCFDISNMSPSGSHP
jgi:hypothetical protein